MTKLPGLRLEAALSLLPAAERLADVGTDHGLFPIAAIRAGKAKTAIATDNKPSPLASAEANIARAGLADKIDLVLADGLSFLDSSVDAASLMGMGGRLIADLLEKADLSHLRCLILGPNTDQKTVRRWLEGHGWTIEDERFLTDHGQDYQLMSAVPGAMSLTDDEAEYGPVNLRVQNEAFVRHIEKQIHGLYLGLRAARVSTKRATLAERIGRLERMIG